MFASFRWSVPKYKVNQKSVVVHFNHHRGATMSDIVKVVAYTTEIGYRGEIGKCEAEAFGDGPRPAVHTSITVNQLAQKQFGPSDCQAVRCKSNILSVTSTEF